ncbi:hypothetical protein [Paracoccus sp. AS002]|nr:hypothetical protein [Paracoccus sp. AS002]MDF3907804.1 hypothetical protein [Paracoccus sp. AS002]
MPKLTARKVETAKSPGMYGDGEGENGGEKLGHGSGGMELLRAA